MKDAQLTLVDSWEEAQGFIDWLGQRRDWMACDTETNGFKWWLPHPTRLIQFGDTKAGWAIPMHRWAGLAERALGRYSGDWVFHNATFDLHQLAENGFPLPARHKTHDTKILHHLSDPLAAHGLKRIAVRLWGLEAAVGEKELKRYFAKNKVSWDTIPYDVPQYWAYAAMDTVLTARLFEQLRSGITSPAYQREMDVARVLWGAERRGMRVDSDYTSMLANRWLQEMLQIQSNLDQWGLTNANSRIQLLAALQAEIDFEPGEWTETGEPKLTEGILADLPGDVAPAVLRYRRLRKWSSAYLEHFLHEQDSAGFIHPSINSLAARTGRMSVTKPGMQTLPRGTEIKDCIIPREGGRLLAIDYDTQELRVGASFAQEPMLMLAFAEGKDLHRFAASLGLNRVEEEVTKDERQGFKTIGYAKFYCAGKAKIAATIKAEIPGLLKGVPVAKQDAMVSDFVDRWDVAFPEVEPFIKRVIALGEERANQYGYGFVNTTGGRQVRCVPGEEYKLVNGLIQGSCADVIKESIVAIDNAGYGELITLPVHDEILFDVPEPEFEDARHELTELMIYRGFSVLLTAHASGPLTRWGDGARED